MKSSGIQCPGKGGSFLNDTVNRADNSLNGELTTNRKLQATEYAEFGDPMPWKRGVVSKRHGEQNRQLLERIIDDQQEAPVDGL
jgi:hypothetical protein